MDWESVQSWAEVWKMWLWDQVVSMRVRGQTRHRGHLPAQWVIHFVLENVSSTSVRQIEDGRKQTRCRFPTSGVHIQFLSLWTAVLLPLWAFFLFLLFCSKQFFGWADTLNQFTASCHSPREVRWGRMHCVIVLSIQKYLDLGLHSGRLNLRDRGGVVWLVWCCLRSLCGSKLEDLCSHLGLLFSSLGYPSIFSSCS